MKGADTMSRQSRQTNKVERQMMNLLSYWASRRREKGLHFITSLPKGARGTTEQDEVFISGRKFFLIYTQVGQAIWTKVLLQEQGAGRVFFLEVQEPESRGKSPEAESQILRQKS